MNRRTTLAGFVVAGLAVAAFLAFVVSPFASSSPDGLEKVAVDQGFLDREQEHALAGGPLAGYETKGVGSSSLSTGIAGLVGVALTFAVAMVLVVVMRAVRRRSAAAPAVPAAGSP